MNRITNSYEVFPWARLSAFVNANRRIFVPNTSTRFLVGILNDNEDNFEHIVNLDVRNDRALGVIVNGTVGDFEKRSSISLGADHQLGKLSVPLHRTTVDLNELGAKYNYPTHPHPDARYDVREILRIFYFAVNNIIREDNEFVRQCLRSIEQSKHLEILN